MLLFEEVREEAAAGRAKRTKRSSFERGGVVCVLFECDEFVCGVYFNFLLFMMMFVMLEVDLDDDGV